ncbi:receptor-type tyrosine-protein phosphatase eta-like [Morone saxatilis]|uniref:receptor-type tyrosine-protein phosphatase eta-like n=1 Tax=Morone saxatilis TaxID=34816 RepID=UPI0015E22287|nr:receptor-type tyrosine-protein phosphatase eta-like [Morone saxatilis]
MAESVPTVESSDEEEFYDAPESFSEQNCEKGENTPATAQSDYVLPPEVTVLNADQETVCLGLPLTDHSCWYKLQVDYSCDTHKGSLITKDFSTVKVEGLNPGTEYTFSITRIADNGSRSKATSLSVFTEPSPPAQIAVYQANSESLSLRWDPPVGEVKSYIVTCCSEGETVHELTTDTNNLTISDLKPGACYSLQVSAQHRNGRISKATVTSAHTKTRLESLLEDLGLERHYTEKLSLSTILQIDEKTITDKTAKCNSDLPWYFLKKLMMVNVAARNVKCTSVGDEKTEVKFDNLFDSPHSGPIYVHVKQF